MECTITPKTVGALCRVCLTTSKNLTALTTPKDNVLISDMLEAVTCNKVILNEAFPSQICQMCLSFLKIAYEFQMQFKKSQECLERATNIKSVHEKEAQLRNKIDACVGTQDSTPVAVELIYGGNKFDLNDVLVIENEETEPFSFQGFLKNLGTEVSAQFLHEFSPPTHHEEVEEISIEVPPQKPLDLSRLAVRKDPEECTVVIEDRDTQLIVKTLYECPTCLKILPSANDLQHHKSLKHPSFLVCDKCGHLAQTQSQLYHHMQKHKGKRFECDQCDKKYDTSTRLKFHLEKHKNERRFLCTVCGKNFNYYVSLKYHMKLHAEKSLVCNICGLKFRMPNTLKRHLRTHTKDKPYNCEYCSKGFSSKGEQTTHEMLHTGVRPYSCEFCGKGFTKSDNLRTHYLSHPGPRQCSLCHKSFLEMDFLQLHMKRAHKECLELLNEDDFLYLE